MKLAPATQQKERATLVAKVKYLVAIGDLTLLVEETFYAPYGEILSGGEVSRFDYEGKEFSSLTEDYDFKFRKYNPAIGIFTQPEQIFPNVYDPQQLNRYAFERRNPYKYVDEDGKTFTDPQDVGGFKTTSVKGVTYNQLKVFGPFIRDIATRIRASNIGKISGVAYRTTLEPVYDVTVGFAYSNLYYLGGREDNLIGPTKEELKKYQQNALFGLASILLVETAVGGGGGKIVEYASNIDFILSIYPGGGLLGTAYSTITSSQPSINIDKSKNNPPANQVNSDGSFNYKQSSSGGKPSVFNTVSSVIKNARNKIKKFLGGLF